MAQEELAYIKEEVLEVDLEEVWNDHDDDDDEFPKVAKKRKRKEGHQ